MNKKKIQFTFVNGKKIGCLKKLFLKILCSEVQKGGIQFLWKMVLWGATFNAVVVVGVVFLLLFRLSMAILWYLSHLLQQPITNLQIWIFTSCLTYFGIRSFGIGFWIWWFRFFFLFISENSTRAASEYRAY